MGTMTEGVVALVFAVAVTFVDRLFISGPYMGVAGILLSIAAALAGWYIARAAAVLLPSNTNSGIGYSMVPVMVFSLLSAAVFIGLAYVKMFDMTKVDYTGMDVFYHLLLVMLSAFTIRMAASSIEAMR